MVPEKGPSKVRLGTTANRDDPLSSGSVNQFPENETGSLSDGRSPVISMNDLWQGRFRPDRYCVT
jgi:hypothetical protein